MSVRIYFEPRDVWVGVYWTVKKGDPALPHHQPSKVRFKEWSVYVCLLPCFPIRFRWLRGYKLDANGKWVPL